MCNSSNSRKFSLTFSNIIPIYSNQGSIKGPSRVQNPDLGHEIFLNVRSLTKGCGHLKALIKLSRFWWFLDFFWDFWRWRYISIFLTSERLVPSIQHCISLRDNRGNETRLYILFLLYYSSVCICTINRCASMLAIVLLIARLRPHQHCQSAPMAIHSKHSKHTKWHSARSAHSDNSPQHSTTKYLPLLVSRNYTTWHHWHDISESLFQFLCGSWVTLP